jgi:hypothetical protein
MFSSAGADLLFTVTVSTGAASPATQGSAAAMAHATPKPTTILCTLRAFAFMTCTSCWWRRHVASATGTVHARKPSAECGNCARAAKIYG